MLWFRSLCPQHGVVVTAHADTAEGVMRQHADGAGEFTEVVLRPVVTAAEESMIAAAGPLRATVREKCFIARSVSFPVRHEPRITTG